MDTFVRFLYEFISVFFKGIEMIVMGIVKGIAQIFTFSDYFAIVQEYHKDFNMGEWPLVIIAIIIMIVLLGLIVIVFIFLIRKIIKFRKKSIDQESMLNEIADLNKQVSELVIEKQKILAMKVSQLGLKPGDEAEIENAAAGPEEKKPEGEKKEEKLDDYKGRFSKLHAVDLKYKDYKIQNYGNTYTMTVR